MYFYVIRETKKCVDVFHGWDTGYQILVFPTIEKMKAFAERNNISIR